MPNRISSLAKRRCCWRLKGHPPNRYHQPDTLTWTELRATAMLCIISRHIKSTELIKHKVDLSKLGSPKSRHKSGSITVQSIKCIICGYYQRFVNIYLNVIINCMVVWWLALFQFHSKKVLSGNQGWSLSL